VSICGIPCAAYNLYASAQSLDFLDLAENCSFLNRKLKLLPIIANFHFWMGTAKLCLKGSRLSPGMALPAFEAQGIRHKVQGKSKIEPKLPCALPALSLVEGRPAP
jgi:hypothetical protein